MGVLRGSTPTAPLVVSPLTFDTDSNVEVCLSETQSIPEFIDETEDDEDFYARMAETREEEEQAKKERAEEIKREAEERKKEEAKQTKKTKKKKTTKTKKKTKVKDEV